MTVGVTPTLGSGGAVFKWHKLFVQAAIRRCPSPRTRKPFSDNDLITTTHGSCDALCTTDPIITTTIIGSIAHNLSA
jgi:hypothetical protein